MDATSGKLISLPVLPTPVGDMDSGLMLFSRQAARLTPLTRPTFQFPSTCLD